MEGSDSPVLVHLLDSEIFKIKLSFSSLTNTVIVCPVVANLYSWKPSDIETWAYCKAGVPVLVIVHDSKTPSVIKQMQLCIVDRENGFATWRESVTKLSEYKMAQKNFHTIKVCNPKEEGEMAGIKFPSEEIAAVFFKDVQCNIPEETDTITEHSPKHYSKKKSLKTKDTQGLVKKLSKEDISSPCMFTHVTSINNSAFNAPSGRTKASMDKEHTGSKSGFVRKTLSFSIKKR